MNLRTLSLTVATAMLLTANSTLPAQEPSQVRRWAVLIGAEKYHRATPLRFTVNDVRQIATTLRTRGNFEKDCILEMTDSAPNPRFQPLRASLQAELPEFLKQPGPQDQVIVYFSGHGFRDKEGKLYLAPLDCDPQNPAETAIAVETVREQIAACKAAFKLLIIDACHAGSEKGAADSTSVSANELGDPFAGLDQVLTIASSSADEKSQLWDDKEQSVFSYWLNQGLKGHADTDGDGGVDVDELYEFVSTHVKQTADMRFPRKQTPRRIVRAGIDGVPVVIRLQPQTLKELLADVAEQLAVAVEEHQAGRVGVLEFISDTREGELLGADYGLLGRYCSGELEKRLLAQGTGKFSVIDRRALQGALAQQEFGIDDLASRVALKDLSDKVGGMPVIVLGTLRSRHGRTISLQCTLKQTHSDDLAGAAGGSAQLNESEWAMLGRSVQVKPEDRRPPLSAVTTPVSIEDRVVSRLDERADGPHPLLDPTFPARVWLTVGRLDEAGNFRGDERKPVFRDNDCFLPVRNGEVFQIHIENKSGQIMLMRLLVDGLNTLPEKETDTKGVVTYTWGHPVNLGEAREWVLDPARATVNVVRGFVTQTGADGELRRFTVVDADKSLAARREFTEQIGVITAAFYAPASQSRRVGVDAGRKTREDLTERGGVDTGALRGVVHIHYVDADELQGGRQ